MTAAASKSKRFAVVGLAKSGLAIARVLAQRGAEVLAFDEGVAPAEMPVIDNVTFFYGPLDVSRFLGCEAVVVSPGVPLSKPVFEQARQLGHEVLGEVEMAARLMPEGRAPILAITGTNGKSTTTALLGELMSTAGFATFTGGNLGLPFSEAVGRRFDMHVLELSSFQLEGMKETEILGAGLLNLTVDHLDRYASMADYGEAKARIFLRQPAQGFAVVNADDAAVVSLSKKAQVPVYGFSLGSPSTAGLAGLISAQAGTLSLRFGKKTVWTIDARNRALRGTHNVQNAMAAVLLAHLAGADAGAIQKGLNQFMGLPHRLEFVRTRNGVDFVNDSKATNVESALVALAAIAGPVWLIAGGKGKGASYAPLASAALGKVKGVLTIGADAENIAESFRHQCKVIECGTLARAVERAAEMASSHDTVLLSPACASYDQFKNFEHRGDVFRELVRAL
jgi:UDP-N-acetylmuramoylalanine--D-glutamate ligase